MNGRERGDLQKELAECLSDFVRRHPQINLESHAARIMLVDWIVDVLETR